MSDNEFRDTVVALAADLMFASRIRGAAEAAGRELVLVRRAAELAPTVERVGARLVLVDLDGRSGDPVAAIAALKANATTAGVPVVAFGSHVAKDLLESARDAGAERVLARSAFVQRLGALMAGG